MKVWRWFSDSPDPRIHQRCAAITNRGLKHHKTSRWGGKKCAAGLMMLLQWGCLSWSDTPCARPQTVNCHVWDQPLTDKGPILWKAGEWDGRWLKMVWLVNNSWDQHVQMVNFVCLASLLFGLALRYNDRQFSILQPRTLMLFRFKRMWSD